MFLQPMFSLKYFDKFSPKGRRSEGFDTFRFFLSTARGGYGHFVVGDAPARSTAICWGYKHESTEG